MELVKFDCEREEGFEYVEMTLDTFLAEKFGEDEIAREEFLSSNCIYKKTFVNIHQMVSEETFGNCISVITDWKEDPRLKDLNAIVYLGLKQKGRGQGFEILQDDKYMGIIHYAMMAGAPIGMDSCSANKAAIVFEKMNMLEDVEKFIEPCESTSMSFYTNVEGKFFPCSFAEDVTDGIDMLAVKDFDREVWHAKMTCHERKKIQDNGRSCPYFEV